MQGNDSVCTGVWCGLAAEENRTEPWGELYLWLTDIGGFKSWWWKIANIPTETTLLDIKIIYYTSPYWQFHGSHINLGF